jgi:hypothetical protein
MITRHDQYDEESSPSCPILKRLSIVKIKLSYNLDVLPRSSSTPDLQARSTSAADNLKSWLQQQGRKKSLLAARIPLHTISPDSNSQTRFLFAMKSSRERKKRIKPASQTHQQSPPTPEYNCPPSPPRQQYPCRTCTCSPRRFLSRHPTWPSSRHLLRGISGTRGRWPSVSARSRCRGRARGGVGGRGRWRDSAGWWCGGSRSRGSSGCRRGRGGRRLRGSGWVRRPTGGGR